MPRLCVTKIRATPVSCWMSFRRSRYCAWIVTSRFVVGSSAMTSLGPPASAMAPTMRWRMPPLALALARQILALEEDAAADDAARSGQESDDRHARRGLAAPGLADQPE